MQLARLPQNEDKNIAVILPDSGMYYVETGLFDYNDHRPVCAPSVKKFKDRIACCTARKY